MDCKCGHSSVRSMGILVVCLTLITVVFLLFVVLRDPALDSFWAFAKAGRVPEANPKKGLEGGSSLPVEMPKDKLLGGLLVPGFDERSCLSRYQSVLYHKELQHKPSSYLISRLRSYEALHKRCGPYTETYNKTLKQLKSGRQTDPLDCNYVVWIPWNGLGNRMLALTSTFLYALLTNRVLLVDPTIDMPDLFCEPFLDVSWLLSPDFPLINQFSTFNKKSPHSYGNMLRKNIFVNSTKSLLPPFVYLHLVHDYDDHDKLFFCDQDQYFLQKVPWLILKTDNYFIPSLFFIPSFEQELSNLFPKKETVFHFLGRYLFHPTNSVWDLITTFYQDYLAKADERIGIQIRVFNSRISPFQRVLDQILACTAKQNLLPEIKMQEPIKSPLGNQSSKAVLITSLSSMYLEKLKNMYGKHSTVTGEVIGVYQPSHEKYQQTHKHMHNRKAWADIYLLSLTDVLVTSSWSTFGYVAQGLGGLKPWILYKPMKYVAQDLPALKPWIAAENWTTPDNFPCSRGMSMEPCFLAPPFHICKARMVVDPSALVPHVRHCEDMSWGLKLVDNHN